MKRLLFLSLLGLLAATPAFGQDVLLEDFASMRLNLDGVNLWQAYPEGTQAVSIVNQQLRVVVPASGGGNCAGPSPCLYVHFFAWPYIWPGGFTRSYVKSGTFDPNSNRLTFWVKPNINLGRKITSDVYVGTYSKPHSDTQLSWQGRHFYHYLPTDFYANRWHKIVLNRKATHEVGQSGSAEHPENPTAPQVNYFDGLTRWYFGDPYSATANSTWLFDDVRFSTVTGEPDNEIASLKGVYTGTRYTVGWSALKNVNRSFEVRYNTASMKPNGFLTGTDGGTRQSPGSDYTLTYWDSPNMAEVPDMYVAVRVQGQTAFSEIHLPASGPGDGGGSAPPQPPTGVRVTELFRDAMRWAMLLRM